MFPTINKKETGVNLRRIMDMRGVKPKDIQEYLGFGCVQSVYRWLDGVSMPKLFNQSVTFDYESKLIQYIAADELYEVNLIDKLGLDADEIINMKMSQNEAKYPVDKAK